MHIFVGNLAFTIREQDLRELFAPYGVVDRINLLTDRETGRPRGFGFVEVADDKAAQAAIAGLQGKDFPAVSSMSMKPDSAQSAVQGVPRVVAVVDAVGSPLTASRSKWPRLGIGGTGPSRVTSEHPLSVQAVWLLSGEPVRRSTALEQSKERNTHNESGSTVRV